MDAKIFENLNRRQVVADALWDALCGGGRGAIVFAAAMALIAMCSIDPMALAVEWQSGSMAESR